MYKTNLYESIKYQTPNLLNNRLWAQGGELCYWRYLFVELCFCEYSRKGHTIADQEKMSDMDKDMNPILNKDNYEYWKTMMKASMVFLSCYDAVNPELIAAERAKSEYVKLNNKARA